MLGKALNAGEFIGISDTHIDYLAYKLGDLFAIDPANREQRLMKELWDEATESEQKVLASLMIRLVEKS